MTPVSDTEDLSLPWVLLEDIFFRLNNCLSILDSESKPTYISSVPDPGILVGKESFQYQKPKKIILFKFKTKDL